MKQKKTKTKLYITFISLPKYSYHQMFIVHHLHARI
ncbi:hypothetical protein DERF_009120 [Dermatophagoides farinae]|uniref:Uncharacterized protein n=1 Tax=Dermatophagoides farinae TaxID=6954 RepID=A0A922HU88_DERFA|nr:hypothetical protein DERF_009120 [Dermatophagoides farinae]